MSQADFEKNWIINAVPSSGSGVATNQGLGINGGTMTHSAAWNGTTWNYNPPPFDNLTGSINLVVLRPFTINKTGTGIHCTVPAVLAPIFEGGDLSPLPAESWTAREV